MIRNGAAKQVREGEDVPNKTGRPAQVKCAIDPEVSNHSILPIDDCIKHVATLETGCAMSQSHLQRTLSSQIPTNQNLAISGHGKTAPKVTNSRVESIIPTNSVLDIGPVPSARHSSDVIPTIGPFDPISIRNNFTSDRQCLTNAPGSSNGIAASAEQQPTEIINDTNKTTTRVPDQKSCNLTDVQNGAAAYATPGNTSTTKLDKPIQIECSSCNCHKTKQKEHAQSTPQDRPVYGSPERLAQDKGKFEMSPSLQNSSLSFFQLTPPSSYQRRHAFDTLSPISAALRYQSPIQRNRARKNSFNTLLPEHQTEGLDLGLSSTTIPPFFNFDWPSITDDYGLDYKINRSPSQHSNALAEEPPSTLLGKDNHAIYQLFNGQSELLPTRIESFDSTSLSKDSHSHTELIRQNAQEFNALKDFTRVEPGDSSHSAREFPILVPQHTLILDKEAAPTNSSAEVWNKRSEGNRCVSPTTVMSEPQELTPKGSGQTRRAIRTVRLTPKTEDIPSEIKSQKPKRGKRRRIGAVYSFDDEIEEEEAEEEGEEESTSHWSHEPYVTPKKKVMKTPKQKVSTGGRQSRQAQKHYIGIHDHVGETADTPFELEMIDENLTPTSKRRNKARFVAPDIPTDLAISRYYERDANTQINISFNFVEDTQGMDGNMNTKQSEYIKALDNAEDNLAIGAAQSALAPCLITPLKYLRTSLDGGRSHSTEKATPTLAQIVTSDSVQSTNSYTSVHSGLVRNMMDEFSSYKNFTVVKLHRTDDLAMNFNQATAATSDIDQMLASDDVHNLSSSTLSGNTCNRSDPETIELNPIKNPNPVETMCSRTIQVRVALSDFGLPTNTPTIDWRDRNTGLPFSVFDDTNPFSHQFIVTAHIEPRLQSSVYSTLGLPYFGKDRVYRHSLENDNGKSAYSTDTNSLLHQIQAHLRTQATSSPASKNINATVGQPSMLSGKTQYSENASSSPHSASSAQNSSSESKDNSDTTVSRYRNYTRSQKSATSARETPVRSCSRRSKRIFDEDNEYGKDMSKSRGSTAPVTHWTPGMSRYLGVTRGAAPGRRMDNKVVWYATVALTEVKKMMPDVPARLGSHYSMRRRAEEYFVSRSLQYGLDPELKLRPGWPGEDIAYALEKAVGIDMRTGNPLPSFCPMSVETVEKVVSQIRKAMGDGNYQQSG